MVVAARIENSTHLYHQIIPMKVTKTLAFDTNRHLKRLVDNSLLIINPIEVEAPAPSAGLITESGTKYATGTAVHFKNGYNLKIQ